MSSPGAAAVPGTVEVHGDRATLRFERHLRHEPECVWAALTDPAALREWLLTEATIERRVGGRVEMVTGPARVASSGRVLA